MEQPVIRVHDVTSCYEARPASYDPGNASDGLEKITVTPRMAEGWLERFPYPGNRSISKARVSRWQGEMAKGAWRLSTLEFYRDKATGKVYLCNGQHRLLALVKYGGLVQFRVTMDTLPSMEEIRKQYEVMDEPASSRTFIDVYRGAAADTPEGITVTDARRVVGAVTLIRNQFNSLSALASLGPKTNRERVEAAAEWSSEAQDFRGIVLGTNGLITRSLWATPMLGVSLVLLRHCNRRATDWLKAVAEESFQKGEAAWCTHRYLLEAAANQGVSGAYRARYLARCWNAWHEGELLHKAYPDVKRPILLLGTPWNGKQEVSYR